MAQQAKANGAGRPKGSRNKRSLDEAKKIQASGLTPLEYFASVYQDKEQPERLRMDAAKAAAPYVHSRLSSVDLDLKQKPFSGDVSDLSDAEIETILEAIGSTQAVEMTENELNASIILGDEYNRRQLGAGK